MDVFTEVVIRIIKEQEAIIGPVALEQARKVGGLKVDWPNHKIEFEGDKTKIVESLIEQYQALFGQTSVEVCREAVSGVIAQLPSQQVPALLR